MNPDIAILRVPPRSKPVGIVTVAALVAACAAIALLALYVSLPLAGILYAIGFIALTWVRTDLALMLTFAAAPFVWDVGGGPVKMAASELSLALAAPILTIRMLASGRRAASNPLKWPIACYFAVCVVSTLINGDVGASITSMVQMVVYLGVAVFVFSSCVTGLGEVLPALYGFVCVAMLLGVAVAVSGSSYILGLHKNAVGSSLAFATVIAVELWLVRRSAGERKQFLTFALCVLSGALVLSLSRGAWLGAIVGVVVILTLRRQFRFLLRVLALLIPIIAVSWLTLPDGAREYATSLGSQSHNIKARLVSIEFAYEIFENSPAIGVGVGLRKQYDATNLVMSTLAETGVVGLVAFLSIFVVFGRMVWRAHKRISRNDPLFSFLAIGAALLACKFAHGCVDHYWGRGLLPVWASAGLAIYAANSVQRRHSGAVAAVAPGKVAA